MTNFRVKIISNDYPNIEPRQNESISMHTSTFIFSKESICDYNLVIIHLEDVNDYYDMRELHQEGVNEFFNKPSIIVCLSDEERVIESHVSRDKKPEVFSNYNWLPEVKGLKIVSKKGKSLQPTSEAGRFGNLFNTYNWRWRCSFSKLPPKYRPIANNISGQSVALKAENREGMVFIIPTPDIDIKDRNQYSTFFRLLIDISEEEIEELAKRERKPPDWLEKSVDPLEFKLFADVQAVYDQFHTLYEARKLLYETGTRLTQVVSSVMSKIGFNTELKEEEGRQDIEICEDDISLVIEVTSSEEDWINIRKTRQLLDWCRRFEQEQNKKPKGILIANHFCNLSPTERDVPFTNEALKQGESEEFCLMTTVQLYDIFCKFSKGEIGKDEIKKLFLETAGLLKSEG